MKAVKYDRCIAFMGAWYEFHRTVMNGQLEAEEIQFASVEQSTMLIDAGEFLNGTKPEGTSSYGLGQLILNGIDMGHKHFIVSLGNVTVFDAGPVCYKH